MTVRPCGGKLPRDRRMALPVYTVDSEDDGKSLCVLVGKLGYDGIYRLTDFSGNFEDLDNVTQKLHDAYQKIKASQKPNKEE